MEADSHCTGTQAEHIVEGYEKRGVCEKEAERRAWAPVYKDDAGGKKPGGSRARQEDGQSGRT